jgi:hypothetical protein
MSTEFVRYDRADSKNNGDDNHDKKYFDLVFKVVKHYLTIAVSSEIKYPAARRGILNCETFTERDRRRKKIQKPLRNE